MQVEATAGFAIAVLPLAVTPGASFTLTTTYLLRGERTGARWCVLGTGLGILTHGTLAGLGLSALVLRSAQAYGVIKILAAIYLVILGIMMLRNGFRARAVAPESQAAGHGETTRRSPLGTAYLANVLNPKAAAVHALVAPCTTTIRNLPSEVLLEPGDDRFWGVGAGGS